MAVQVLIPVWGQRYVRDFLRYSLPTLLSPGNLPAVAEQLPCRIVILTTSEDEPQLRRDPALGRLRAHITTELRRIDHLVSDGNHSTTLTLAYTEAVIATGRAMLDTCFVLLVSDYIVADGSLGNVIRRMRAGASGVTVGNFQVTARTAYAWLEQQLAAGGAAAGLAPRTLMAGALAHLHPATIANAVNLPYNHNVHTNRLFWRIDEQTLLGRFYLKHPICVRPEVTDFVIGSSVDYSYIPEMCPSGNVGSITDSDEYLIVEVQPEGHEAGSLRYGPLNPERLARSLASWTTAEHRANVRDAHIYHAGEPAEDAVQRICEESGAFVADVDRLLRKRPKSQRRHPFWRGAIGAFYETRGRALKPGALAQIARVPDRLPWRLYWWWRARYVLLGRPPEVYPWDPGWPDYQAVIDELRSVIADPSRQLLVVVGKPTVYSTLLSGRPGTHVRRPAALLEDRCEALAGTIDCCLVEVSDTEARDVGKLLDRIRPLLVPHGRVIVAPAVEHRTLGQLGAALDRHGFRETGTVFVRRPQLRRFGARAIESLYRRAWEQPWLGLPALAILGVPAAAASTLGNLSAVRRTHLGRVDEACSSFVITLERSDDAPAEIVPEPTAAIVTREPQYARLVELTESSGLASLGLMSNQVWHDDPRRLAFVLARYKFAAKMLSGRGDVGEVGCGDAFGTRIVQQEVGRVTAYDFDRVMIDDVMARQSERWPLAVEVRDIVESALPRLHDAIFSLDMIEHIAPADEEACVSNLRRSLTGDGVLLIGTPSLESQQYASPISRAGHVNCKSGPELRALMERHFHTVLMFSMNDEVVHTGFHPMAHYLFAVCSGPR